jgi:hypothetical protein
MADDLLNLWENLSLSKGEGAEVEIQVADVKGVVK